MKTKEQDKYDGYLSDELLAHAYAASKLDVPGAWDTLRRLSVTVSTDPPLAVGPVKEPVLGVTSFAVVDVEATGFAGHLEDRVVEIAVVHVDPAGQVTGSRSTLLNPSRGVGPSHVHGIHDNDVRNAPAFAAVADWLMAKVAGRGGAQR